MTITVIWRWVLVFGGRVTVALFVGFREVVYVRKSAFYGDLGYGEFVERE
jgi:hypothetical protein